MRTAPAFFFDAVGQVRLDRWSRRRAVLVGDAGYCPTPLTGLGASLALVGAYVLAGELAAADGDHHVAFRPLRADHAALRHPEPADAPRRGQGASRRDSAIGIGLRNASMRWMSRWPMRKLMAGLFAKAADVELPDYASLARR